MICSENYLTEKSKLNEQIVEGQDERRKLKATLAKLTQEQKTVLEKHKNSLSQLVLRLKQEQKKRSQAENERQVLNEVIQSFNPVTVLKAQALKTEFVTRSMPEYYLPIATLFH